MMTTPQRVTTNVLRLCKKIGGVDKSAFINVRPRSDSQPGNCFLDVDLQVLKFGGSAQYGWLIWEFPGILIEGEFHAVWWQPDNSMLDVSIKPDGETQILFAPDRVRMFNNRRVPNIRMAIGSDPKIKQLIKISEEIERLEDLQCQKTSFGEVLIDEDLSKLYSRRKEIGEDLANSRAYRRAQLIAR
jgi:hypothetical protein